MAGGDFHVSIRHLPEEAAGLEDYVVRASDGEAVGTVAGLLERDGRLLLAVERAAPPIRHDRRVVPWSEVEDVDHEALAVWLHLSREQFERAEELDPAAARADDSADARRVVDLPEELEPRPEAAPGGPVDRTIAPLLPALVGAIALGVLVIAAAATALQTPWVYLGFVVVAVLAAGAVGVAYRTWRDPYEPRGARKP